MHTAAQHPPLYKINTQVAKDAFIWLRSSSWQLTWAYSPYNWPKTFRCMLLNHSHLITSPLKLTMNVDGWSEQVTWQTLPNFWPHTVLEEHCWTMVTKLHYSPKWPCIMAIRVQPSKKKGEIAYALGHTRTSHLSSQ